MRSFVLIFKVLFLNGYGRFFRKKHIVKSLLIAAAFLLCMAPTMYLFYNSLSVLFEHGMGGLAMQTGLVQMTAMMMLFVFLLLPSTFYLSADTKNFVVLPVKGSAIVWAKTAMVYLSQMTLMLMVILPLCLAYGLSSAFMPAGLLILIFNLFAVSLTVLMLIGLVVMLVMYLFPYFRNKNRLTIVMTFLSLCGVFFLSQSLVQMETMDPEQMVHGSSFFYIQWMVRSVMDLDLLSLLWILLILIASAFLYQFVSGLTYLPVAVQTSQTALKKSRKSAKLDAKVRSAYSALCLAELKKLFRSPSYLMNTIIAGLVIPIVMVVAVLVSADRQDLLELTRSINLSVFPLPSIAFLLGTVLSLAFASANSISSTAISREGLNGVRWMKSVPVSWKVQILAKLTIGTGFSILDGLVFIPVFHYLFIYPWWIDLIFAAGIILASLPVNVLELLLDLRKPKLIWDNEAMAVKNNMNAMISLFACWGLCVLFAGLYFLFFTGQEALFSLIAAIALVLISGLLFWRLPSISEKLFSRLS